MQIAAAPAHLAQPRHLATPPAPNAVRAAHHPGLARAGALSAAGVFFSALSRRRKLAARRAEGEQVVTPWEVEAGEDGVDYDKLIETFGCQPITSEQIERIERLTGKKGEAFYIYTGRGPSSESLHLGHLVPFLFTKWLQEAFDVPLVIELTDDEKFLFKKDLTIEESRRLAWENAKDIIACGFDPKKTFIFRDSDYIQQLYPVTLQIQKRISLRTAQNTFGFDPADNIGKVAFAAVQASPAFSIAFPDFLEPGRRCFVPQAIDQDPYFRLCRRVAEDWLLDGSGHQTKMSASVASTALYMTDTEKKLRKKINKHAFSGGGKTEEEQREHGANLDVDELERIGEDYAAGKLLTGEVKKRLGDVVSEIVREHQEADRVG
ncbi:Tryptophan--tRNA ligase [Durusdinium trenchii]|uniref:tryptophan--tRNA ligase n=1 Tax=Durusdinium trenchii TaxID=1381693 RepID=A0ABP0KWL5_9DINO